VDFPPDLLVRRAQGDEDTLIYVEGLVDVLEACYERGKLPSELGSAPWAQAGRRVGLGLRIDGGE
jgi:hypothetical protein